MSEEEIIDQQEQEINPDKKVETDVPDVELVSKVREVENTLAAIVAGLELYKNKPEPGNQTIDVSKANQTKDILLSKEKWNETDIATCDDLISSLDAHINKTDELSSNAYYEIKKQEAIVENIYESLEDGTPEYWNWKQKLSHLFKGDYFTIVRKAKKLQTASNEQDRLYNLRENLVAEERELKKTKHELEKRKQDEAYKYADMGLQIASQQKEELLSILNQPTIQHELMRASYEVVIRPQVLKKVGSKLFDDEKALFVDFTNTVFEYLAIPPSEEQNNTVTQLQQKLQVLATQLNIEDIDSIISKNNRALENILFTFFRNTTERIIETLKDNTDTVIKYDSVDIVLGNYLGDHDSSLVEYRVKDTEIFKRVQILSKSKEISTAFPFLDSINQRTEREILLNVLGDSNGHFFDKIAFFPSVEAIKKVLVKGIVEIGHISKKACETLKLMSFESNWEHIISILIQEYPALEERKIFLLNLSKVNDDLLVSSIKEELSSFSNMVVQNEDEDAELKKVSRKNLTDKEIAGVAKHEGIINEKEYEIILGAQDVITNLSQKLDENTGEAVFIDPYYLNLKITNILNEALFTNEQKNTNENIQINEVKKIVSLSERITFYKNNKEKVIHVVSYKFIQTYFSLDQNKSDLLLQFTDTDQSLIIDKDNPNFIFSFHNSPEILTEKGLAFIEKVNDLYQGHHSILLPKILEWVSKFDIDEEIAVDLIKRISADKAIEIRSLIDANPLVFLSSKEGLDTLEIIINFATMKSTPLWDLNNFISNCDVSPYEVNDFNMYLKNNLEIISEIAGNMDLIKIFNSIKYYITFNTDKKDSSVYQQTTEMFAKYPQLFDANFLAKELYMILGKIPSEITPDMLDLIKSSNANEIVMMISFVLNNNLLQVKTKYDLNLIKDYYNQAGLLQIPQMFYSFIDLYAPKVRSNENSKVTKENFGTYIQIMKRLETSPSKEVQKLKNQLVDLLLNLDNPVIQYDRIESIFIKNNLPTLGKLFKVFEVLHPKNVLDLKLFNEKLSPTLQKTTDKRRRYLLYRDLLKVHIDSGNDSLKTYLELIKDSKGLLDVVKAKGSDQLTSEETNIIKIVLGRLQTLYETSNLKPKEPLEKNISLQDAVNNIYNSLDVKDGQTLEGRVVEMFMSPLGYESIDQVLDAMNASKQKAHQRGLSYAEQLSNGDSIINEGDFLKGIDAQYFDFSISQNGSVCKEFLGASADSDATPLDTDIARIQEGMLAGESRAEQMQFVFENTVARVYAKGLMMIIKDRGKFSLTNKDNALSELAKNNFSEDKYELFMTGVRGTEHYGIRTGIAATEIDCLIATPDLLNERQKKNYQKVCYTIARNGYYIPIIDNSSNLLFKPEDFYALRKTFEGITKYNSDKLDVEQTYKDYSQPDEVTQLIPEIKQSQEKINQMRSIIKDAIIEVLTEMNIPLHDGSDSILGTQIIDTGSTGRSTNAIGDYDFDLMLLLDDTDYEKINELKEKITERLGPEKVPEPTIDANGMQLRTFGSKIIEGLSLDIDVGMRKKTSINYLTTNAAIEEKLSSIKNKNGEAVYLDVVANIVLAKKFLKESGVYKKNQGGWAGVGTENWILSNGGTLRSAVESILNIAKKDNDLIPLNDFKKLYPIWDAGLNLFNGEPDNYIELLSENSYAKLVDACEEYITRSK